jgi:hypothetical protein
MAARFAMRFREQVGVEVGRYGCHESPADTSGAPALSARERPGGTEPSRLPGCCQVLLGGCVVLRLEVLRHLHSEAYSVTRCAPIARLWREER